MRRALLILLSAFYLAPSAARADEPPEMQLEFVRKLREKGYANLSLEYLQKLAKGPTALKDVLPLEIARSRVAIARQKEPGERLPLFAEARKDLEAFVKGNPKGPQANQARVEIARVAAYQGQALLTQALRQEEEKDAKGSAETARRAEHFFKQAGAELDAAAKALTDPNDKLEVEFERGRNFLDQARTHPRDRARAALIADAIKTLEAIETTAAKSKTSPPVLHLARAWLMRAYQQGDQPDKATEKYRVVMKASGDEAAAGQRWAGYFRIQFIPEDVKLKLSAVDKLHLVQKEALEWLKTNAAYRNTPEGYGVRFELARAYLGEAQSVSKDPASPTAAKLYGQAQKELSELAASESDYAERAAQLDLSISFHRIAADKTPMHALNDFAKCYLRGRYELFKMQEAAAKSAKSTGDELEQIEKQRTAHLRGAIAALRRAVLVAGDGPAPKDLTEARFLLTFLYLAAGDPYRAAVAGEALGRASPPTRRSPAAAGYALQAYGDIAAATKSASDRARLDSLARFVLESNRGLWETEAVTQVARYQLAQAALGERKFADAIAHLERIAPDFPGYTYTQAQLVLTAVAARNDARDEKAQRAFQDRAEKALARMPPLADSTDTTTAQMYFAAQLQRGNFLYGDATEQAQKGDMPLAAKTFAALDKFQAALQKEYDKHGSRFSPDNQAEFQSALTRLKNLSRYGNAQAEYRAGNYDRVLSPDCAAPILDDVRKLAAKAKAGEPVRVKDARLTGEILGLAMRANVQKGKLPEAKEILGLVRRLADEEGQGGSAAAILQALVEELKSQVRELRDKQDKKKLDATVKNFSAFLDELAKQPEAKGSYEHTAFLANCYASLDKHGEAAKLYAQLPEPKIDPKKAKLAPEEERELKTYWLLQVNYGRALRQAKDFKESKKVLDRTIADPRGYGAFLAEKEQIHLLEDQGLYGKAVTRWGQFQQHPALQRALGQLASLDATEQRRIKELFYDCVFQYAYCTYMYGKANKKDTFVQRAAERIVAIEQNAEAWELVGDRCRELLRNEPGLQAEYAKKKTSGGK